MTDLLPCPFCGETEIVNLTEDGRIGVVGCTNCGAENNFWEWNTRPKLSNKQPLPVDGVCKCECNSTIREIFNGAKLRCTKCGGNVLANPSQNTVPCGTCGKPMEDRGAAAQWCGECYDNR